MEWVIDRYKQVRYDKLHSVVTADSLRASQWFLSNDSRETVRNCCHHDGPTVCPRPNPLSIWTLKMF